MAAEMLGLLPTTSSHATPVMGAAADDPDAPASKLTGLKSEAEEPGQGLVTNDGALTAGKGDGQLTHSATASDAPANRLRQGGTDAATSAPTGGGGGTCCAAGRLPAWAERLPGVHHLLPLRLRRRVWLPESCSVSTPQAMLGTLCKRHG